MSTVKVTNLQHASSATANLTLAADGTVSGGLPYPNRNLLHNGAMQVAQRGTSTAGITGSNYYSADRWACVIGTLGTWTQSVENDAPTGSGLANSLKMLVTTADASPAAGDRSIVVQRLEGQNVQRIAKGTASAQQLTLSFWVKSNATGTYIAELIDSDNTRHVAASYSISSSATWERKAITFPADTTGAFVNDNSEALLLYLYLGAGSNYTSGTLATTWATTTSANRAVGQTNLAAATNNYWQITGVQLEVGPVATPFEFKSYGQELAECQRYYYRITGTAGSRLGVGWATGTTVANVVTTFPTTMRSAPSALDQSGAATDYSVAHANTATTCSVVPAFSVADTATAATTFTVASGLTTGDGLAGRAVNTSAYLGWSADL